MYKEATGNKVVGINRLPFHKALEELLGTILGKSEN